ncbi:MAG: HAD family hydrolase [Bacteroidia bacterium]|nr:HAD family hydrolase [Bacteroidia bacterium]
MDSFLPKAFLFDMDGVLFDSMPYHAEAWIKALASVGIEFSEYQVYLQEGCTGAKTINDAFLAQKNRNATQAEINEIYARKSKFFEQSGDPIPMPYAKEVLNCVRDKGIKIGMVTGSGQKSLLSTLNHYYLGIFSKDNMVTAFDVVHGKPNPEPYLKGLEKLSVSANETVVIENAPMGVKSAVSADIYTIAVNTGILKEDDLKQNGANLVLGGMHQLLDLLLSK